MKPPLGSGERFAELTHSLAGRPGIHNPGALAAFIGRKKYGNDQMEDMADHGETTHGKASLHMKRGRASIG